MGKWKSKNEHKYLLQYHIIFVCKYRKKLFLTKIISDDIKQFSYEICQKHNIIIKYMETDKDHIHYMIETEKKSMNKTACNNYCNQTLKTQYEWLRDVDKFALTNAIYNMDGAYQKLFREHTDYPRFRSRRNKRKSYTTNFTNNNIEVFGSSIKLPKLQQVKAKIHRKFTDKIKSSTVSQNPSGKYFVSVLMETEHVILPQNDKKVGMDLGLKDLCIISASKKYENPKALRKYEKRLAKAQRKLVHKQKLGRNRDKQRIRVARLHEKITNIRKDYLHKISHKIISEN